MRHRSGCNALHRLHRLNNGTLLKRVPSHQSLRRCIHALLISGAVPTPYGHETPGVQGHTPGLFCSDCLFSLCSRPDPDSAVFLTAGFPGTDSAPVLLRPVYSRPSCPYSSSSRRASANAASCASSSAAFAARAATVSSAGRPCFSRTFVSTSAQTAGCSLK